MPLKPSQQAQQRAAQEKKKKQQQYLLIGGGVVVALLVIGAIVLPMLQRQAPTPTSTGSAACDNLLTLADEGREHLVPGETPTYNQVPPSSGTHNVVSLPSGIYDSNVDVTQLVHSLEHGYVIMFYNGIPQNEIDQLVAIQRSDPYKVIVAPYPNMPYKVALVAWDHRQVCEGVNEQAIRSFTAQFRNQGPEQAQ